MTSQGSRAPPAPAGSLGWRDVAAVVASTSVPQSSRAMVPNSHASSVDSLIATKLVGNWPFGECACWGPIPHRWTYGGKSALRFFRMSCTGRPAASVMR